MSSPFLAMRDEIAKRCKTDCEVVLYNKGKTKDGAPIKTEPKKLKCFIQKKTRRIYTGNSMESITEGECYFAGDIAPELKRIDYGNITIDGEKYEFDCSERPEDFDRNIIFTRLFLK